MASDLGDLAPPIDAVLANVEPSVASAQSRAATIAHGADCGVARAFGEPDLAQCRVALRDTDAKPQIAATFAPGGDQLARSLTNRHRHLDRAFCRVGGRYRVIEKHHDAVARELVERALELANALSRPHERPESATSTRAGSAFHPERSSILRYRLFGFDQ